MLNMSKSAIELLIKKTKKNKKNPEHPVFQVATLTPEDADYLLSTNSSNRAPSQRSVQCLTTMMCAGYWMLTGETIKIDTNGRLLDGQHRMLALRAYNKPLEFAIAFCISKKAFEVTDTGKSRTATDILKMAGYKNVSKNAAALRVLLVYKESESFSYRRYISPQETLRAIERYPKITNYAMQAQQFRYIVTASIIQFFMLVTQEIDPDKSYDFFSKLLTGENLKKGDPILNFRTMNLKYKSNNVVPDKRYTLASIILTWNSFLNEELNTNIKWDGKDFPLISGVNRKQIFGHK